MKKHLFLMALAFIALPLIFSSCRKDISLPDPSLDKLFGSWEWVETSGDYGGEIHTPQSDGDTWSIEFNKDGISKQYKNGKKVKKYKFTLSVGTSVLTNANAWFITFDNSCIMDQKKPPMPQFFSFGGQDTLFISDDFIDGYNYVYVRK
jgi:hypothetical protein